MKTMKKLIALALTFVLIIFMVNLSQTDAAKKVSLSKSKATINVGSTVKIKVKNSSSKATVAWKIASKKIAKITRKSSKGKAAYAVVKGIAEGKTKITASYKSAKGKKAKTYTCTVIVQSSDASSNASSNSNQDANANNNSTNASNNANLNNTNTTDPNNNANNNTNPGTATTPAPNQDAIATPAPEASAKPEVPEFVDVVKEGLLEIPLRDEFRKTGTDGSYLTDGSGNYIPLDGYETMNTSARYDAENSIVYCETANNVIFYIPDVYTVDVGDTIEFEITGTYNANSDSGRGFRIWLVDTAGKDPSQKVSSGDPITTSEQFVFTRDNGNLTLNSNNEFTIKKSLVSRVSETDVAKGERSNGISTALTIKASSWNGLLGDLKITSVKIGVRQ